MQDLISLLEAEIRKQTFGKKPESLYRPMQYLMRLSGKRLRPLLVLLSYSMYRDNAKDILRYAIAVEAFHNFTLMHDDIMDRAPLRRGKPTVHEKWNTNTAILSGDAMLVKVYESFLDLPEGKLSRVLTLFSTCATEVCEGQQWDMEFESTSAVTEAQYLNMVRLKTAVLLGFSLELGALLAGASLKDQQILKEAGINFGIGFQLKDDLLDVYADKKEFGKQVGGDIIANKKTFLLIKALRNVKGEEKKELSRWLGLRKFDKRKKVSGVTSIYNKLEIQSITEKKISEYFDKGFAGLKSLSAGNTSPLVAFIEKLASRQK